MTPQQNHTSHLVVQIAAGIIVIAGLMAAQSIIIPIILSLFISIIYSQPILWLEKKKIPWGVGVLLVLLIGGILLFTLGGVIGRSINEFFKDAPKYEESLRAMTLNILDALNEAGAEIDSKQLFDLIDPGKVFSFTVGAVGEIGKVISDSFVVLLITIFMLLEVKEFIFKSEKIEKLYGNSLNYFEEIGKSIRHYLSIKTLVSLLTGLFIWIWLLILGVDYAFLWGVIAFLLNYIPNIGSIVAAIPTVLLALLQLGVGGMIWTAFGYVLVNIIIGNVIEPKIMGKGLGLSTLIVFLSLIVWGFIFGTVGMFLSIPITISIKIILEQNERTRWLAILLGTKGDTEQLH